jgi:hypothetical protein
MNYIIIFKSYNSIIDYVLIKPNELHAPQKLKRIPMTYFEEMYNKRIRIITLKLSHHKMVKSQQIFPLLFQSNSSLGTSQNFTSSY